jgi:hypothetical protein
MFKPYLSQAAAVAVGSILGVMVIFLGTESAVGKSALCVAMVLGAGFLVGFLAQTEVENKNKLRLEVRNFYGVLHVKDDLSTKPEEYSERTLLNGTINHGSQILDEELRYKTTSYYVPESGVGRAMRALQKRGPMRVGVIGLGAGVLSNYGRAGDFYRIFEINPLVENIAQTQFTFYPHSPADKAILMGDARLTLERMPSLQLDILAGDAFSSDAIPVHLLTREALAVYFKHLKENGVLALHISNRYLDLEPVCAGGAEFFGKKAMTISDDGTSEPYASSSTWVLVTSDPDLFGDDTFNDSFMQPAEAKSSFRPWTDDYSNIVQILKVK